MKYIRNTILLYDMLQWAVLRIPQSLYMKPRALSQYKDVLPVYEIHCGDTTAVG